MIFRCTCPFLSPEFCLISVFSWCVAEQAICTQPAPTRLCHPRLASLTLLLLCFLLYYYSVIVIGCCPVIAGYHFSYANVSNAASLTIYTLVSVLFTGVECESICFCGLPGNVLAAPASALCGWKGVDWAAQRTRTKHAATLQLKRPNRRSPSAMPAANVACGTSGRFLYTVVVRDPLTDPPQPSA